MQYSLCCNHDYKAKTWQIKTPYDLPYHPDFGVDLRRTALIIRNGAFVRLNADMRILSLEIDHNSNLMLDGHNLAISS